MSGITLKRIWESAQAQGRADFLVLPNRRYSFANACSTIMAVCAHYDGTGLEPGDRIVICSDNDFAVATAFLAAVLHGIVPTNLASGTPAARGRRVIEELEAKLLVCDETVRAAWADSIPALVTAGRRKRGWKPFRGNDTWPFETAAPDPVVPRLPDDNDALAYILFTSGSISSPAGVTLTLGNLLANISTVAGIIDLRPKDRMFNDLPMAHTDGLIHGPVSGFATCSTIVRAGGFQISRLEEWLNTVSRESCTHVIAPPFIWSMVDRYAEHDDYFEGPEVRLLMSSAARFDPTLWRRLEERFGHRFANEYGMTETVMAAFHAGPLDGMGAMGTIGLPVHCEAKLDIRDGDTGELLLKGPNITPGYWRNPERTASVFTDDGWFRTGDMARRREDGSYELVGRIKSMINSGGVRIHPDELNEALESHESVLCAVTVGLPDPAFGEIAVTAVELADTVAEADLINHARSLIEPAKVPKRVIALQEIPRGDSGKPRLADLETMLQDLLEKGGTGKAETTAADPVWDTIRTLAAEVFSCDPESLSPTSTQDDVEGWDSYSQLQLFITVEAHFQVKLPTNKLTQMRSLADLGDAVKAAL